MTFLIIMPADSHTVTEEELFLILLYVGNKLFNNCPLWKIAYCGR